MEKLKLLDLFSGIGGFSLGLERTGGFETVAFCEIEEFPRKVLAQHWPEVNCYEDIRTLTADALRRDGISVDAICGGFPCQDISTAGKGAGIEGERSGLWGEFARLIGELRPQVVFVENVSALLSRGLDRVLGDLASIGYDAEWHCIPASYIGAYHRRDRLWLVSYPNSKRSEIKHALRQRDSKAHRLGQEVSNASGIGSQGPRRAVRPVYPAPKTFREVLGTLNDGGWSAEPALGRMAHGVSNRVDRLGSLGNAVVPQIPELLGNAYLQSIDWGAAA